MGGFYCMDSTSSIADFGVLSQILRIQERRKEATPQVVARAVPASTGAFAGCESGRFAIESPGCLIIPVFQEQAKVPVFPCSVVYQPVDQHYLHAELEVDGRER